jgi:hypothetical protein
MPCHLEQVLKLLHTSLPLQGPAHRHTALLECKALKLSQATSNENCSSNTTFRSTPALTPGAAAGAPGAAGAIAPAPPAAQHQVQQETIGDMVGVSTRVLTEGATAFRKGFHSPVIHAGRVAARPRPAMAYDQLQVLFRL